MARPSFRLALAGLCAALGACPENAGVPPPTNAFFYPVAAVASADGAWLYVVNSDFDLRYNGGTVVAVDLAAVRDVATRRVPSAGCRVDESAEGVSDALRCEASRFIRASATRRVNPFAVDAALARYGDRERLYVAVRGDGSVTWFDLNGRGDMDCGASSVGDLCDVAHRVGIDPAASPLGVRLPPDPSAISVDPARGWIVVSHQSSDPAAPRASLLFDRGSRMGSPSSAGPVLLNAVGGLATGLSALAFVPGASASARSTWVATSRAEAVLTFLQAYPGNANLQDAQPYLYRSAAVGLTGLNRGRDSRSVVVDPAPGASRLFVVNRDPEALLVVDLDPMNPGRVTVGDVIPLPPGPSRVLASYDAALQRTFLYVVAFDARRVSVVDPVERRIVAESTTNRGPHGLARDPSGQFLYVMDFNDNALEVLDLRSRTAEGAPNPSFHRRVLTLATGVGN